MASGPCLRRCRVVRRYMPTNIEGPSLDVKLYTSIHVSMDFGRFQGENVANTGFPCPKVPIHRKLGSWRAAHSGRRVSDALLPIIVVSFPHRIISRLSS